MGADPQAGCLHSQTHADRPRHPSLPPSAFAMTCQASSVSRFIPISIRTHRQQLQDVGADPQAGRLHPQTHPDRPKHPFIYSNPHVPLPPAPRGMCRPRCQCLRRGSVGAGSYTVRPSLHFKAPKRIEQAGCWSLALQCNDMPTEVCLSIHPKQHMHSPPAVPTCMCRPCCRCLRRGIAGAETCAVRPFAPFKTPDASSKLNAGLAMTCQSSPASRLSPISMCPHRQKLQDVCANSAAGASAEGAQEQEPVQ